MELLKNLFTSDGFMPHGHCYLWVPGLVWLHVVSDMLIGLAYVAISTTLVYLVHRGRSDIPFHSMFLAFGLFIVACGGTHFMEVWTLWTPTYWLSGIVKAITAVASVVTAIALPPMVPLALKMVRAARVSEERRLNLESAHAELNALYGRLQEFDQLKTQFFANVSHELRTPLGLVMGPAHRLLAAEGLSDTQRRDLRVIDRNARTLLKHVNDLLDVAKLEAGKMTPSYAETDLTRLVRLTAAHFDALAPERQVDFTMETPRTLPAQVDPEKLQRVVLNLLSNAFKFVPGGGGRVRCALTQDEGEATIVVEDNGPGVPVAMRQAIFERFRQVEGGANRSFGGTGLGLAIARDFVALHGGTITVDETLGGGARFTVTLPLAAPPGAEVRRAPAESAGLVDDLAQQALEELRSQIEGFAETRVSDRPLVLVVEDNPEMNRFVAETLAEEYRVAIAFDGQEGLEKALSLHPDLILSDVMMPRVSGDQMLREVRGHPELDGVPVVLLTAKADDELRVRLLQEGAQDYLTKPFADEELRARVGNLVTMKRARDLLQRELESHLVDLEGLATEVTDRKRELQSALEAMRAARDHAEHASRVKSNFLGMVSHELRTPLTVITTYLQMLEMERGGALAPRQREMVRKMLAASRRLLGLIESLLEFARIQSGRLAVRVEPIDLASLATETVEEMQPQAQRKQLELRLLPMPELPPLQSDPRLVRLILNNLVDNALKYTEHGAVEVSMEHADGAHRLAVRDTGPGISPEQQTIIFEPFEQLEPIRQKHVPGVGLGLALVREMAGALGGRIELTSQVGAGSTFAVVLPPPSPSVSPSE
jgi:signal transduction histidine kinase